MPANNSAFPTFTLDALVLTSVSPTSFTVAGGVTISGNLAVTGSITGGAISYASTSTGTLTVSDVTGQTTIISSTTDSSSVGTGAFKCLGGGSFTGNLYIGGTLVAGVVTYASTSTGTMAVTTGTGTTLTVDSTTDSTTQADGAVKFLGGVGVAKRINAGSLVTFDSTASTNTTTGSIKTAGGIGALGSLFIGGFINTSNNTASTSKTTGSIVTAGGIGSSGRVSAALMSIENALLTSAGEDLYINANNNSIYLRTANSQSGGQVKLSTTQLTYENDSNVVLFAITKSTGAIQVTSTIPSTSKTTGALYVVGGIGTSGRVSANTVAVENAILSSAGNDLFLNGNNDSVHLRTTFGVSLGQVKLSPSQFTYQNDSDVVVFSVTKSTGLAELVRLTLSNTTDSTSVGSGSIITPGGLGVAKNITCNTLKTVGKLFVGGYDIVLGNFTQPQSGDPRGNTGESRALVKSNDGAITQLSINYQGDFQETVIGSKTNVLGNIVSYNFNSYTVGLSVVNVAGTFQSQSAFNLNVSRVGPNYIFNVRYNFGLSYNSTVTFDTQFSSLLTLFNPYTQIFLGTGHVNVFRSGDQAGQPYSAILESTYTYPVLGAIYMNQVAPNTTGIPDSSQGYLYTIKTFAYNSTYIQKNQNLSNPVTPNTRIVYNTTRDANALTPNVSNHEVNLSFTLPVLGYDLGYVNHGAGTVYDNQVQTDSSARLLLVNKIS